MDKETYHQREHEVEEANTLVEDLRERLHFWLDELERRQRALLRVS